MQSETNNIRNHTIEAATAGNNIMTAIPRPCLPRRNNERAQKKQPANATAKSRKKYLPEVIYPPR